MRIRLRTVLVVVALAAVLLKAEMTSRRWASYGRQADFHAAERRKSERILQALKAEIAEYVRRNAWPPRLPRYCGNAPRIEKAIQRLMEIHTSSVVHHGRLEEEYRRR